MSPLTLFVLPKGIFSSPSAKNCPRSRPDSNLLPKWPLIHSSSSQLPRSPTDYSPACCLLAASHKLFRPIAFACFRFWRSDGNASSSSPRLGLGPALSHGTLGDNLV